MIVTIAIVAKFVVFSLHGLGRLAWAGLARAPQPAQHGQRAEGAAEVRGRVLGSSELLLLGGACDLVTTYEVV